MSDQEENKPVVPNSPEPPLNHLENWCKGVKKKYEGIWWASSVVSIIIGTIIGVIGAHWLILGPRVDEAAKKVVLSQEVLEDISSRLRPYAVIDARLNNSSATFEYDEGVGDIVESVDFREGETNLSGILTFKMNRLVKLPLLRPLTAGVYVHSFWRTNKFDWAFEIRQSPITQMMPEGYNSTVMESDFTAEKDCRFFVELLTK